MKLIVLGSGTSVPHQHRCSSGYRLETESGNVLLDISADAPHRMAEEELDWSNLDAIWISHFHLDHMGGLAAFLIATRVAPQTKRRAKPLTIYGPKGFGNILNAMDASNHYRLLQQPFPVELVELEEEGDFQILPGLEASTISTLHTDESLAIRLKDKSGSVLVYTSDTGYSNSLIDFAKNASLLLMECSFHKAKPVAKHLELSEAMQLAEECNPQMLVLTHLYAEWDGIDLAEEARNLWAGETIEAYDGLRLDF